MTVIHSHFYDFVLLYVSTNGPFKSIKTLGSTCLGHDKEVTAQTPQCQKYLSAVCNCASALVSLLLPLYFTRHINRLQNQQVDFSMFSHLDICGVGWHVMSMELLRFDRWVQSPNISLHLSILSTGERKPKEYTLGIHASPYELSLHPVVRAAVVICCNEYKVECILTWQGYICSQ